MDMNCPFSHTSKKRWATLLSLVWLTCCLAGCTEKKDLSPPPLNPHPKEAVHIRVEFDNPEDAKRYAISMDALYQNQQRECGYIANWWVGNFRYPAGQFDIPNESHDPMHADFTIYLDRYNRETCNWEFSSPGITVHDTRTNWYATSNFGGRGEILPGMEYKETCEFIDSDPNMCWSEPRPLYPNIKHHVPITVHVSKDSAPPRPRQPGFFSSENFVKPMNPNDGHDGNAPGFDR